MINKAKLAYLYSQAEGIVWDTLNETKEEVKTKAKGMLDKHVDAVCKEVLDKVQKRIDCKTQTKTSKMVLVQGPLNHFAI